MQAQLPLRRAQNGRRESIGRGPIRPLVGASSVAASASDRDTFIKRHKNNAADAEAICEAAQRPSMRFVPVKSEEQHETSQADPDTCKFTVSRTVHPGGPFFFDSKDRASGSPLVERLLPCPAFPMCSWPRPW